MASKITLSTIKAFVRKNPDLYIKCVSSFDGMTDCVEQNRGAQFKKAEPSERNPENTLGVRGAWFVKQSRDYFRPFQEGGFKGFEVYNCCGTFVLAVQEGGCQVIRTTEQRAPEAIAELIPKLTKLTTEQPTTAEIEEALLVSKAITRALFEWLAFRYGNHARATLNAIPVESEAEKIELDRIDASHSQTFSPVLDLALKMVRPA